MKTFRNLKVQSHQPTPKVGQVWESRVKNLYVILSVYKGGDKSPLSVLFENEKGDRSNIGVGWLDGDSYSFIGEYVIPKSDKVIYRNLEYSKKALESIDINEYLKECIDEYNSDPNCRPDLWVDSMTGLTEIEKALFIHTILSKK